MSSENGRIDIIRRTLTIGSLNRKVISVSYFNRWREWLKMSHSITADESSHDFNSVVLCNELDSTRTCNSETSHDHDTTRGRDSVSVNSVGDWSSDVSNVKFVSKNTLDNVDVDRTIGINR